MHLFVVVRETGSNVCYECNGGGGTDTDLVAADSGMEAIRLMSERYPLHEWEDQVPYQAFRIRETTHKKPRVLSSSEWRIYSPEWTPPAVRL